MGRMRSPRPQSHLVRGRQFKCAPTAYSPSSRRLVASTVDTVSLRVLSVWSARSHIPAQPDHNKRGAFPIPLTCIRSYRTATTSSTTGGSSCCCTCRTGDFSAWPGRNRWFATTVLLSLLLFRLPTFCKRLEFTIVTSSTNGRLRISIGTVRYRTGYSR